MKDVKGVFIFNFIVNFRYSGVFIVNLNIFHILQVVKNAEIRALYRKKEKNHLLTCSMLSIETVEKGVKYAQC